MTTASHRAGRDQSPSRKATSASISSEVSRSRGIEPDGPEPPENAGDENASGATMDSAR